MTTSTLTNTEKHEHIALIISCCSGIILLLWCSWFAYNTNSLIINLDANAYIIASIVDLITLGVSLIQKKKKTKTHPMGYGGYIPLINLLRSCLLFFICIQSFLDAVNSFAHSISHDSH